jgi:TonB family protein
VASAVDHIPSTVSPSASPAKISGENAPNKPRMNAVACEVQIIATGARPSEKGGQRELFTEETSTALVFENGGVLKLSSAVIVGQLLFLTHKETKREVVAQVTRKRDFRPTICYVEVEFSEPSPGFWGIEFPKVPATAPAKAAQKEAGQPSQVQEYILIEEPSEATQAPSAEEVSALKDEVEVLREQLKFFQTQIVAGNPPASTETPAVSQATAPEAPGAPREAGAPVPLGAEALSAALLKLQPASGVAPGEPATEISGALASDHDAHSSASASVQAEPADTGISEEDLLPKPALSFNDNKQPKKPAAKSVPLTAEPSGRAALRKDILFAAFVIITAAGAWYQNLLPWLPQRKNVFSGSASSAGARPAPRAPQKTANAHSDESKPPLTSEVATTAPDADAQHAAQTSSPGGAKTLSPALTQAPTEAKSAPDGSADAEAAPEKAEITPSAGKRSAPTGLSKAALVSAVPPSDGAGVVPPKLIKSVRAVASPSMLQYFSPGNGESVTLDALVDTTGHVKSMKVLSGAASLRNAAMEALKQYQYEPATRRGKAVPAHVSVTVKFLFEP